MTTTLNIDTTVINQSLLVRFLTWIWAYSRDWDLELININDNVDHRLRIPLLPLGFGWVGQELRLATAVDALGHICRS